MGTSSSTTECWIETRREWDCGRWGAPSAHSSSGATRRLRFSNGCSSGEYGGRVGGDDGRMLIVVNAFLEREGGESCRRQVGGSLGCGGRAPVALSEERSCSGMVYACRRARSASGVEGTLLREWPGPWRLFDANGERVVGEWDGARTPWRHAGDAQRRGRRRERRIPPKRRGHESR